MRRRRSTKPRDDLMDQITAAAAAGDDPTVARLSAIAHLEAVDRRHHATQLPLAETDALAADTVREELRQRAARAHARRDVHGEAAAVESIRAFEEGLASHLERDAS